MNKTKRIMTAVVSLVLASTMCFSIAACTNESETSTSSGTTSTGTTDSSATDSSSTSSSGSSSGETTTITVNGLSLKVDGNGNLTHTSGTTLNMNVGYSTSKTAQISYTTSNIGGSVTMPDGVSYSAGDLKPAWKALASKLDVNFTDNYTAKEAANQITDLVSDSTLGNYNVITGESEAIVNAATSSANTMLDLSKYLDYMPNYKKFLQDNPIVYLSLTSNTYNGAMYYAPYFDGNDDIEKYELAKKNWISTILDGTYIAGDTITFKSQVEAKSSALASSNVNKSGLELTSETSSVESYMGTTGEWWIETTDSSDTDDYADTVKVVVSYDDALAAAQNTSTALGKAYYDAVGSAYTGTSGNIVDIQNAAINATNGGVNGYALTQMLRAYIDVAYQDADGNKFYTDRADVFNAVDAAWDVDLLVALMRCVVTFGNKNLDTDTGNAYIYGVTGRQNTTQRMNDMVSLAGELYGVRGLASRYNYTYIDSDGNLQEARVQEETYDALDKMHAMVQEGLYNANEYQASGTNSFYTASSNTCEALLGWDYVQTQTAYGGFEAMGVTSGKYAIEDGYDFEPIVTPVSKWNDGDTSTDANVDGISYDYDGEYKYMRFTESWRSVKTTGFCVPYDSVKNDPDKLSAVLEFIDYFFSNDGQILMSFGTQSTNGNTASTSLESVSSTDNGWWYADEVEGVDISTVATLVGGQYYINDDYAAQYFCYNNKLYTGTYYNGKQYPTMTNANLAFYYGYSVNGVSQSSTKDADGNLTAGIGAVGITSYTNYARYIIGAALPIGNKLQAFEFQCTPTMGIDGGDIVGYCLTNGTISHVYQSVGTDNGKGYWYTIVPSTLPFTSAQSTWISANVQDSLEGTVFVNTSKTYNNYFIDIIYYGLGSNVACTYFSGNDTIPSTAAACIELLQSYYSINTYVYYMQTAWNSLSSYYDSTISQLIG